jgi:nicotinic acid mononucleotide adenylyltransferase
MTVAHVAIIEAALGLEDVEAVHLVLSIDPLGKPGATSLHDRIADAERCTGHFAGVEVRATAQRLLADVADGYDVLILGTDKWEQINDPSWYGSESARDDALGRLPEVVIVPRLGAGVPRGVRILEVDPAHAHVSSTAVRAGRDDWRAGGRTPG